MASQQAYIEPISGQCHPQHPGQEPRELAGRKLGPDRGPRGEPLSAQVPLSDAAPAPGAQVSLIETSATLRRVAPVFGAAWKWKRGDRNRFVGPMGQAIPTLLRPESWGLEEPDEGTPTGEHNVVGRLFRAEQAEALDLANGADSPVF